MPTTIIALMVFLLFFPGFLTQMIIELLTPKKQRTDFERFISAAGFSFLLYAIYLIFHQLAPDTLPLLPVQPNFTPYPTAIIIIFGESIVIGALLGRTLSSGSLYSLLRGKWPFHKPSSREEFKQALKRILFRWTSQTGHNTVWETAFAGVHVSLVRVHLKDGRIVIGAPLWYSDHPKRRELFITHADPNQVQYEDLQKIWIIEKSEGNRRTRQVREVEGPGILLTPDSGIEVVEFLA